MVYPQRIQLEVSAERLEELKTLQELLQLKTKAALVDAALRFLEWGVIQQRQGRVVASLPRDGDHHDMRLPPLKA